MVVFVKMSLLHRQDFEYNNLRHLYFSLIFFNLLALNNCYEVNGFSEFDSSQKGFEEYEFGENHFGMDEYMLEKSQNSWDELEEEAGTGHCDLNGRTVSGVICERNLQLEVGMIGLPVSKEVVPRSTYSRSRTKHNSNKGKFVTSAEKYKSYMQRFVNLFLKAVISSDSSFSIDRTTSKHIKLEFIISDYEFTVLQDFGEKGEKQGVKIEEVSDVLTTIFSQKAEENQRNDFGFSSIDWMSFTMSIFRDPQYTIIYMVLLMFVMTLWFAKTHSFRLAFFTLALTIFFAGFGCNWMRMYEEREVKKYVNNILNDGAPYHCKGNPLAWYEVVFYKLFGKDCLEFYNLRDIPSMISVSPTDVIAETFSSMIVNPSVNIGKAYGSFIESVASSVPFLLKPIAIFMGFLVPLMFVMVILCFLFDYELSLSPMGFHLTPGWFCGRKRCIHNSKREKYIEDMSNVNDKEGSSSDKSSSFTETGYKEPTFVVTDLSGLKSIIETRCNGSKDEETVICEETILKEDNKSRPNSNESKKILPFVNENLSGCSK